MGITDLSEDEANFVLKGNGSSYKCGGAYNAVISRRLGIGWTTHTHTAVDVGVWAYGPIANLVKGDIDNTDIAKNGAKVLGVDLIAVTKQLQSKYMYPMFKVSREGTIMYLIRPMVEALGGVIARDVASGMVTLTKDHVHVIVDVTNGDASIAGTDSKWKGTIDNGMMYLPLEVYNKLSGKNMTWDALSERIVLN